MLIDNLLGDAEVRRKRFNADDRTFDHVIVTNVALVDVNRCPPHRFVGPRVTPLRVAQVAWALGAAQGPVRSTFFFGFERSASGMGSLVYLPLVLAPVLELLACDAISRKLYLRGLGTPPMFKLSRVERRKCCTRWSGDRKSQ
jgi:hypothetical protein